MNRLFKYIGLGICASFALLSCEEDAVKPLDSAIITESVSFIMSDENRAKIYVENDSEIFPMLVGESMALGYKAVPEEVTYPGMVWESTDNTVVSVDQNGKVTALKAGNAVITIAPEAMNVVATASMMIKVVETVTNVTSISLSDNSERVDDNYALPSCYESETMQLTAVVSPEEATYKTVLWSSSDPETATVDPVTGVVTGVKMGKVTITATALDSDKVTATREIFIDKIINPLGMKVTNAPAADALFSIDDLTYTFKYETYPEVSTRSLIEWTSSEPSVATVDKGVVTFLSFGSVTITAKCPASEETPAAGYETTFEVTLNIPVGYYNDHFTTEKTMWNLNSGHVNQGATQEWMYNEATDEHYWLFTPYLDGSNKGRGDIQHNGSAIYLDPAYPIICARIDDVNDKGYDRNINIDSSGNLLSDGTKYAGNLGGSNNKWKTKYKCSDGSAILVYDLATQNFATGGLLKSTAKFGTFQFKYADIKTPATAADAQYRFFWFMTFKSEDDMTAYLNAWSAEKGISYE